MIKLEQIEKSYPLRDGRSTVLRGVELQVAVGEFICIMGPSGAGKSSLLNVLGLMDQSWSGRYWLDGTALHSQSAKQRQLLQRDNIGFVFQHYHLLDDMTVGENLELPLSYRDLPAAERKKRVNEVIERFDLGAKRDLYPRQLSGGQQQLTAVARAIVTRPKLLLADEPTGALHSEQGRMIMETLSGLNRDGMTIVQVTHSVEAAAFAGRTVQMRDGAIVA